MGKVNSSIIANPNTIAETPGHHVMRQPRWQISSELKATLRAKNVLTARDQLILHELDVVSQRPDKGFASFKLKTQEVDGDVYYYFVDGPQHEARVVPAVKGMFDRLFWVNLLIACDGPDVGTIDNSSRKFVTRNYGKLENAVSDLDAFMMYYMPMRLGNPTVVSPHGTCLSPGYFDCTKRLNNPTIVDIDKAIHEIHEWITINSEDPEFTSVQINFMFAGHGYGGVRGESGIVIADGEISCQQLAKQLLDAIPAWKDVTSPSRLDMFLDCCHSGAIARDLLSAIICEQDATPEVYSLKSRLGIGKVFCSCLDDESSLELPELKHGLFSFAFLNEFSRRAPDDPDQLNLALRDVGWFSDMQQHPFLFDYTHKEGPDRFAVMFPSAKLEDDEEKFRIVTNSAYGKAYAQILNETPLVNGEIVVSQLDLIVKALHHYRDEYMEIETKVRNDPTSRPVFERKEYYDREKVW